MFVSLWKKKDKGYMNHKHVLHLSFHSGTLYLFDSLVSLSIRCAIWTVCPVKHNIASVWMRMCMLSPLCPCFANSLQNECVRSFTGHFLFIYTVLPTLRGTVKGVLLTSNINCAVHFTKRIDVSFHIFRRSPWPLTDRSLCSGLWAAFISVLINSAISYWSLCCTTTFDGLIGSL